MAVMHHRTRIAAIVIGLSLVGACSESSSNETNHELCRDYSDVFDRCDLIAEGVTAEDLVVDCEDSIDSAAQQSSRCGEATRDWFACLVENVGPMCVSDEAAQCEDIVIQGCGD